MNKILIIEDDLDFQKNLRVLLESQNFSVLTATNGNDGLSMFSPSVSLVILDIMIPGISGLSVCREIRKSSFVPILFLTGKSTEKDKVSGLLAGGDDYLTKPFSSDELLARIHALLRRHQVYDRASTDKASEEIRNIPHQLTIHPIHNEVSLRGKNLHLTDIEYRLLLLFLQHPSEIFSLDRIYTHVWEEPFLHTSANTVMVHIKKLRQKIEDDPKHPKIIRTIWGKGYRLG